MKYLAITAALVLGAVSASAATQLALKTPGGATKEYNLESAGTTGVLRAADGSKLPMTVNRTETTEGDVTTVTLTLKADDTCWYNISESIPAADAAHASCEFYMPGFWYHHNMRSPEKAPSFRTSDSWSVREDRLSSPLTGVFDPATGNATSVMRINKGNGTDCILQNLSGDVILPGKTSIGSTGFCNVGGKPYLTVAFPYIESPRRYIRKLTLIDPVRTFQRIDKGATQKLTWQIRRSHAADYSDFVASTWQYAYDVLAPQSVDGVLSPDEAKKYLAEYFKNSYVSRYPLKYYSCAGMRTDDCANTDEYQVGFVGRVLLNAFNAFEYGEQTGRKDLTDDAAAIFESTLANGFSPDGFFIESVRLGSGKPEKWHSIRRQSEGVFAMLFWLDNERRNGRKHPEWDSKIRNVLDNLLKLQSTDGSFPRKFNGDLSVVDASCGSTPCATVPLTMGYKYFKDKRYLNAAKATADYLEKEIIDKADYFSSTLDANCEDKEAALYATTALYYLTNVTKGAERKRYMDLCRQAAYFSLSWYYMWDVPFADSQMLGDVGFKSRGWGNVSVENNHIDVYIFEFATILEKLAAEYGISSFSDFAGVIKTSMLQLMPTQDSMFDIAKTGYYPEVVQHTTWDYGHNGKGFYNDIFAPGWTVASLWQMLSPTRVSSFFD